MNKIQDDILSYREMCDAENKQTLQRGMNFRLNPSYSVILMSQRPNAPYKDKIYADGIKIEYEGHDISKRAWNHNPKLEDQPRTLPSGKLTQNGRFARAVDDYKLGLHKTEPVKVYEKIVDGVWSLKGFFDLIDYEFIFDDTRKVFRFKLKLSKDQILNTPSDVNLSHTRLISSEVKKVVWKRDQGKCVICGDTKNLHFDHDLPYSLGGTSLSEKNVRLLCMKHNLEKSNKIQ